MHNLPMSGADAWRLHGQALTDESREDGPREPHRIKRHAAALARVLRLDSRWIAHHWSRQLRECTEAYSGAHANER